MDPIIAYGLTASAIVVLIVQAAKYVGVADSAAPWLALLLSVLVVAVNLFVHFVPEAQQFVEAAVAALLVFLSSVGLYHTGKNVAVSTGAITPPPSNPPPA